MTENKSDKTLSLSEEYLLKEKEEKQDVDTKPVKVKEVENPVTVTFEEVVTNKGEEKPAAEESKEVMSPAAEESKEVMPPAAEESTETTSASPEDNSGETAPSTSEESTEATAENDSGDQEASEETPELKLETAPADFRFPTTNQTRHCFTRYIEYHRCVAAKGDDAPECDKFAKFYRSLCPGEWIDKWNEQRENGTFPGPL